MSKFLYLFQRSPQENTIRENKIKLALKNNFCGYTTLIDKDRAKADRIMSLLLDKDYAQRLVEEAHKWVVGEDKVIRAIHLCAAGRLVQNASRTSFNLNVNSETGSGKDYITHNTLRIFPKEIMLKRTRITKQAFTYWHANEETWTWDGKVIYLEDISPQVLNSETMKVMLSSGSHTTVVKDQRAIDLEVKGKPVIIVTTAETQGNKENQRRMPTLQLDESTNQTRAIMEQIARNAATGEKLRDDEELRYSLLLLKPREVVVEFASELSKHFPDSLVVRTNFPRFLDLIKASAAQHQYQREYDDKGRIIATGEDYEAAREVLMATTSNAAMATLTHKQKKLLAILEEKCQLAASIKEIFSWQTLWQEGQLRKELFKMVEMGFLIQSLIDTDEKKPYYVYTFSKLGHFVIPSFENIKNNTYSESDENSKDSKEGENGGVSSLSSLSLLEKQGNEIDMSCYVGVEKND